MLFLLMGLLLISSAFFQALFMSAVGVQIVPWTARHITGRLQGFIGSSAGRVWTRIGVLVLLFICGGISGGDSTVTENADESVLHSTREIGAITEYVDETVLTGSTPFVALSVTGDIAPHMSGGITEKLNKNINIFDTNVSAGSGMKHDDSMSEKGEIGGYGGAMYVKHEAILSTQSMPTQTSEHERAKQSSNNVLPHVESPRPSHTAIQEHVDVVQPSVMQDDESSKTTEFLWREQDNKASNDDSSDTVSTTEAARDEVMVDVDLPKDTERDVLVDTSPNDSSKISPSGDIIPNSFVGKSSPPQAEHDETSSDTASVDDINAPSEALSETLPKSSADITVPSTKPTVSAPSEVQGDGTKVYQNSSCNHVYYRGPRGGCYYINSNGNKTYDTSKSCCHNQ